MERVQNLEAMRGIFSILIIAVHVYFMSGFMPESLGFFQFFTNNVAAVDVFMILSGLVIFFLIGSTSGAVPSIYHPQGIPYFSCLSGVYRYFNPFIEFIFKCCLCIALEK